MICGDDAHVIVQLAHLLNRLNQSADLTVKIADIDVAGPVRAPDLLLRQRFRVDLNSLQYPLTTGIGCIIEMARHINSLIPIKIPPLRPRHIRIVGMNEKGHHATRLGPITGIIKQFALGAQIPPLHHSQFEKWPWFACLLSPSAYCGTIC